MTNIIDGIVLAYMFIGLYMSALMLLLYVPNRKELFAYPKSKSEPVSVIIPCYNEGKTISKTIESILALDYPQELIEIIIVDDKSTDNSVEIIKNFIKKYKNIRLLVNEKNSGGAAEPTNLGIKAAKYDYIAVTDADSYPEPDALKKMIGFLQEDKKVGGVTCSVLARNPVKFMQKLQSIEYQVISFTRKLLDFVDAVYVTPGPFALYRKSVLLEIGLFDTKNLTQDIEIVWRLRKFGYRAKMCFAAKVYSTTPEKFRIWWKQRIRWSIGGTQTILKYRKDVFKNGMLGLFIIPFFTISLFIGLFGLGLFTYLILRRILVHYLSTNYSIYANTAIIRVQDLTVTPTILNFFGIALFAIGLGLTMLVISTLKDREITNKNIFNILFYLIIYLTIYPFISLTAIYKLARNKYTW